MRRFFLSLFFLAFPVTSIQAVAGESPSGYACEFKTGASWALKDGSYEQSAPVALTLEFLEIDLDAQSALIKTGQGDATGKVAIARAIGANHFLEVATEGFWNITTIYDKDAKADMYPAVHSRHLGLAGEPVFSQYAGACAAK